jgi:hypothetical protein
LRIFATEPLAIYHDSLYAVQASRLFVACDDRWQSNRQMLIPSMRRHQQGAAFLIVQDHQSATAQNLALSSY